MREIIQAERECFREWIPQYQMAWRDGHRLACVLSAPWTLLWAIFLVAAWPVCKIHDSFCK